MAIRFVGFSVKTGYVFIGLALVLSIVTAVMLKNVVSTGASKPKVEVPTKQIVVMATSLPAGTAVTADDLRVVSWPEKYLPSNSVFETPADVIGRLVKSDMIVGEPVYKEKLTGDHSQGGLPVLIPEGHRAVAVGVSEIKGVAGFVKPGDRVDVLSTFSVRGNDDEDLKITKTVLQNVLVMASAQQMIREGQLNADDPAFLKEEEEETDKKGANAKKKKKKSDADLIKEKKEKAKERKELEKRAKSVSSVTLALTPDQTERLTMAEEAGDIRLVLRSEGDNTYSDLSGITDRDLLTAGSLPEGKSWPFKFAQPPAAPPPAPVASAPPAPPLPMLGPASGGKMGGGKSVELIEGTEKTSVGF